MPVLCVCCDLAADGAVVAGEYSAAQLRQALPGLEAVLAELGPSIRVAPQTWMVDTDKSPAEVMERLWQQVFDPRERVLVIPVDSSAEWRIHSGEGDDPAVAWLGERLKP